MSSLRQSHKRPRDGLLDALADRRRRLTLAALLEDAPMAERDLASSVAATETGVPRAAVDDERATSVHVDLHHVHLPKLREADLVDRRPDDTVATTDHPVLERPTFRRVVEAEAESLDEVLGCLAHERRRIAVDVLDAEGGEASVRELARGVAVGETGRLSPDEVENVRSSLRHVHLPALADAGLVEVDADRVTAQDRPELSIVEGLLAVAP